LFQPGDSHPVAFPLPGAFLAMQRIEDLVMN
jgi:hypothetical protein